MIVCTYNGKDRLGPSLSALLSQEEAPEFELIVVDNGSTDGTGDFVSDLFSNFRPQGSLRLIKESQPGLLHARLAGLYAAQFDWILFCDDDNVLSCDFLNKCDVILAQTGNLGVLGSFGIPEFSGTKPDWFDRYSSSYAVGPQMIKGQPAKLDFVYGACSVYRKKPLMSLFQNGFTPVLSGRKGNEMSAGDDVEWCYLMQLAGYKIAYSASLRFTHQLSASRLTWDYYLRLKAGISSNAGLMICYTYFYKSNSKSLLVFFLKYQLETAMSVLRYYKNWILWGGKPANPKNQLALVILKSKMQSFLSHRKKSLDHFNQLRFFFGS